MRWLAYIDKAPTKRVGRRRAVLWLVRGLDWKMTNREAVLR